MGNLALHKFYQNIDVLIKIFEMLEFEDQLNLKQINQNLHDMIVKDIQNRKVIIKTYLATYDKETLLDYCKQYGGNFSQLIINGYDEFMPWKPMRMLLNLTDIRIKNVKMFKHDIYWMVENLQNLQYLKLYNVNVISLQEDITNCDFISKSMQKLQIPSSADLMRLIENCKQLKELQIDQAQKYIFEETINHEIISMDNVRFQIKEIEDSFSFEASIYPCYRVIAKTDGFLQVHIDSSEFYQTDHIEKFVKSKVHHLGKLRNISLNSPSLKCVNILVNNSPQLQHLRISNIPSGFKFNFHKSLKNLHLQFCALTSQDLYAIVNNLNLQKLTLSSKSFKQSKTNVPISYASNFASSLRYLRIDNQTLVFEKFFAQYSQIFKNLKHLTFYDNQISSKQIEFLANENCWKLKHLIIDGCHLDIAHVEPLAELKQSALISETVIINDCFDVNSNFLLHLLTRYKVKNLKIYALKCGNVAIANKIDYKLDKTGADNWPKSIRSIAIDNFMFCLNRDFWFDYMEVCHADIQFTIFNSCHDYLYKLYYNSQIRSKLKSIKFCNTDGKVHMDEKLLCQLPISISPIECLEHYTMECFQYSGLLSVLIVSF